MASLFTLERALIAEGGEPEALWRSAASWEVPQRLLDHWVATASDGLAQAIMAALSIIDFEAIVIDGWMPASIRRELVEAIKSRISTARMTGLNMPMLSEGTIGANARALGGASLPLQQRFLVESRRLTDLRGVAPAA